MFNSIYLFMLVLGVHHAIVSTQPSNQRRPTTVTDTNFWTGHHKYDDYIKWIDKIAKKKDFSRHVQLIEYGKSFASRTLRALYISSDDVKTSTRRIAVIEAGLIGCEWTSTAMATYAVQQIMDAIVGQSIIVSENSRLQSVIQNYDWLVVPVANPDGFHLSSTNKNYEHWKRTTKITSFSKRCQITGAHPNKNFAVGFSQGELNSGSWKEGDNFKGTHAFSEACTSKFSELLNQDRFASRIRAYFSLHSVGPHVVVRYGYTYSKRENSDYEIQKAIALKSINQIDANMTLGFNVGTFVDIYKKSQGGQSVDWAKKHFHIRDAYAIYAGKRDTTLPLNVQECRTSEESVLGTCQISWELIVNLLLSDKN